MSHDHSLSHFTGGICHTNANSWHMLPVYKIWRLQLFQKYNWALGPPKIRIRHMTWSRPLRGWLRSIDWNVMTTDVPNLKSLSLLVTKIWNATQKYRKWGGLGLGVTGQSLKVIGIVTSAFDRAHMTCYSPLIQTMRLFCTVCKIAWQMGK